jgi:O-antigen/teichoic acid export membrane protein
MKMATGLQLKAALQFLNRTGGSIAEMTIRSSVWVTLSTGFRRGVGFVSSVILARLLMPEDFGLIGIALVFVRGLDVLTHTGLAAAIIHRTDRVKEAVDAAWTVFIFRGLALAGLMFLMARAVANFYDEPALESIVKVICCFFVIQGFLNTYLILLRKELDFKRLATFEAAISVLRLVVVVTIAYVYRSVWALVVGLLADMALRVVMSYVIVRSRPRFALPGRLLKDLFSYGKFVTGATIVVYLTTNLDNAVIGKVLGMGALGYYALAFQLANLPAVEARAVITRVMFPAFSKLQGQLPALREAYLKVLKVVTTLAVPAAAGIAVLAPEIVKTVYGEKWLPMVGALHILCVFGVAESLAATTEPVFRAIGKPQVGFYVVSLKLMFMVTMIYPLTLRYGIVGAALAVTVPACIEQVVLWVVLSYALECPMKLVIKGLGFPVAAAGGMAFLVYRLKLQLADIPEIAGLVCCVLVGACVYGILIALFDRTLIEDARKYVAAILGKQD